MYLLEFSSCLFVPCLKKFITIFSCTYVFLHYLFQRTMWVRLFLCPSSYIPGINIQLYETFPDFCTVSTTRWLQRDNLWYFPCLNKVSNVRDLSNPENSTVSTDTKNDNLRSTMSIVASSFCDCDSRSVEPWSP